VQLHPIVVQDRPHEVARRPAGTPNPRSWKGTKLTIYPGGGDGAAPPKGGIHSGRCLSVRGRSKPSPTRSSRSPAVTVEKGHGSRGEMMVTRSAITERKGWRRERQEGRFPLLWLSLSGCKNLGGRQEAEQRTVTGPSPRYIKTKVRPVPTFRPDRTRDSKMRSETAVPRTARARTTAAPPTTRPVALTPRRDRHRFWQEKRATLRLRRNNRAKKGTPRRSVSYPFPFFLFLYLLQQGSGKGDTPKGILPREGTRFRASLLIRGSKAGPTKGSTAASDRVGPTPTTGQRFEGRPPEGFHGRLRLLGLRAHY
jgi:hypothetical protein